MSVGSRVEKNKDMLSGWHICEKIGYGSGETSVYRIVRNNINWTEENALKIVNIITETGDFSQLSEEDALEYHGELEQIKGKALEEVRFMHEYGNHQNVVAYHDFCFLDWQEDNEYGCDLLIRMDLLQCIRDPKGRLTVGSNQAVKIGKDICAALIACKSVIHRDIKPNNIFRQGDCFKLGDWGISRITDKDGVYRKTHSFSVAYAAPEQYSMASEMKQVDIYCLGLTLYEICNQGRLPFAGEGRTDNEITRRRLVNQEPFPPPCEADETLSAIIMKACAYEPEARWQSPEEMLAAFEALENKQKEISHTDTDDHRKKRIAPPAVALALILIVAIAVFLNGKDGFISDIFETKNTFHQTEREADVHLPNYDSSSSANGDITATEYTDVASNNNQTYANQTGKEEANPIIANTTSDDNSEQSSMEPVAAPTKDDKAAQKSSEVPVAGILINPTYLSMNNGAAADLIATVSPTSATDSSVTWSSSNTEVATVDNGRVVACGDGNAVIIARAGERSAVCEISVRTVWSDWMDQLPDAIPARTESRTVYQYTDFIKDVVSSTGTTYGDGYLFDYSEVSLGPRSAWSDNYIAESDNLEVYTQKFVDVEGHTEYRYGCWVGADGGHSYCNVMAEEYYGSPAKIVTTEWSATKYVNTGTMWTCASPDTGNHRHEGTGGFIAPNTGNRVWYLYSADGSAQTASGYFWEESRWVDTTYKTQYSSAPKTTIYYFYKMVPSYISEWSTEWPAARDNRTIEEKTQYRYMITNSTP